jgi:hypothetical protein
MIGVSPSDGLMAVPPNAPLLACGVEAGVWPVGWIRVERAIHVSSPVG